MKIRLIKGMNIPKKNGPAVPVKPGSVVEVSDRFARQQIAIGRAEEVKDVLSKKATGGSTPENPESGNRDKMSTR